MLLSHEFRECDQGTTFFPKRWVFIGDGTPESPKRAAPAEPAAVPAVASGAAPATPEAPVEAEKPEVQKKPTEISLDQIKQELDKADQDLEQRFRKAQEYYVKAKAGEIKLSQETFYMLEQVAVKMRAEFDKLQGKEFLSKETNTLIEHLMRERGADALDYLGLIGEEVFEDMKALIENPFSADQWKKLLRNPSLAIIWRWWKDTPLSPIVASGSKPEKKEGEKKDEEKKTDSTDPKKPEAPEKINFSKIGTPSLSDNGVYIIIDGKMLQINGESNENSIPEQLNGVSQYLKKNYQRLHNLSFQINPENLHKAHMKLALIALDLGRMTPFSGMDAKDPLLFLEQNLSWLLNEFTTGTAGRYGLRGGLVIDYYETKAEELAADWRIGSYESLREFQLDEMIKDRDRLRRIVLSQEGRKFLEKVPDNADKNPWPSAPEPSWNVKEGKIIFPDSVTMDANGTFNPEINEKATPGLAKIKEFMQQSLSAEDPKFQRLCETIDQSNQNDPALRIPLIAIGIRLQRRFALQGKTTNAFDYLKDHWGGPGEKIYNVYEEKIGESINKTIASLPAGVATLGLATGTTVLYQGLQWAKEAVFSRETVSRSILEKMQQDNCQKLFEYVDDHFPSS